MFLYRKDKDQNMDIGGDGTTMGSNGPIATTQILIAKHRNGPIGEVEVAFDAERVTFKTIDKRYSEFSAL